VGLYRHGRGDHLSSVGGHWVLCRLDIFGVLDRLGVFGVLGRLGIFGDLGHLGIFGDLGRLGVLGGLCCQGVFGVLGRLGVFGGRDRVGVVGKLGRLDVGDDHPMVYDHDHLVEALGRQEKALESLVEVGRGSLAVDRDHPDTALSGHRKVPSYQDAKGLVHKDLWHRLSLYYLYGHDQDARNFSTIGVYLDSSPLPWVAEVRLR